MRCVRLLALPVLLPVVFPSAVVAANLIHKIRYTLRRSTIAPPVSSSRMHRVAAIRPQPLGERVDMTQRNFEPARKRFVDEVRAAWQAFLEDRETITKAGEVAPRDDRLDRYWKRTPRQRCKGPSLKPGRSTRGRPTAQSTKAVV
jgi:hypothetical protein